MTSYVSSRPFGLAMFAPPDGEEIIEKKEYRERIRFGYHMLEEPLTRQVKIEDNDLPVIAEKYR